MVCPHCGTHVPDDAVRCPACRAELETTMSMGRLEGTFCPSCGALVVDGLDTCPSCGMPVPVPSKSSADVPPVAERPAIETEFVSAALIESAIPSVPDAAEVARQERAQEPPMRRVALATALAMTVMGGAVLGITHPWDPLALDERATEEADLSHVGFPGEMEALSGQDSDPNATYEQQSADELTLELLQDGYASLGSLHDKLSKSEDDLRAAAASGDAAARADGAEKMGELSIEVSNLVDELYAVDVSSGTYAEQREGLLELASWLRNWSDALDASWAVAAADASATEEEVLSPLVAQEEDGMDAFRRLFEESYPQRKPPNASAEE